MKKLLFLMTVMIVILGFTASAFAQPIACTTCKGVVRNVPCPAAVVPQGGAAACYGFDYDINTGLLPLPYAADGYCGLEFAPVGGMVGFPSEINSKAVLHICDCLPDPNVFAAGLDVGVQMEILVDGLPGENGAYWSNGAISPVQPAIILVDTEATNPALCNLATHGASAAQNGNFGAITYYDALGTVILPVALPTDTACVVAVGSRAVELSAENVGAFVLNAIAPLPAEWWWIDIPPIRIDPGVVASGSVISVRIILVDNVGASICSGCVLCECTIPIAQVSCGAAAGVPRTFPYFTSLAAGAWWNGIAVDNMTGIDITVTLNAFVQDGTTDTATVNVPGRGMFVDLLENISWAGTGTPGLPLYIVASPSAGAIDGFAMIANGAESMGYLPR